MNILLLGGSNAGISFGWASRFHALAHEHVVVNAFLGAVGSLYGLMRLREIERAGAARPDLIILEYALNDMMLLDNGVLSLEMIDDALDDIADFCARERIRLILLGLELRPPDRRRVRTCVDKVKRRYAAAAARRGLTYFTLDDILGGAKLDHFIDPYHLTAEASIEVADRLFAAMEAGVGVPRAVPDSAPRFEFTPVSLAQTDGHCQRVELQSSVYRGDFLEIARGGSSRWPGHGRLVGLMMRSTHLSGEYRIETRAGAFRKNAQSSMREIVPKLMLLHYSSRRLWARDDLVVSMPADKASLARLRNDRTPTETPGLEPFDTQRLEIAAAAFWNKPPLRLRLLRRLGLLRE